MTAGYTGSTIVQVPVNLNIRLPPALHAQLKAKAEEQGISLNTLMVALLAAGVGFTLDN